jgi:hypothetical protein
MGGDTGGNVGCGTGGDGGCDTGSDGGHQEEVAEAAYRTGFSPNPQLPTGGRDLRELASAQRTCLRTCHEQHRTSRTALEVLFLASLCQSDKKEQRTIRKEGRRSKRHTLYTSRISLTPRLQ